MNVLEPTGVRQVKLRDTIIPAKLCGAGFEAASYLEPKNVSFKFITVGEGICYSVATGSNYPSRHNVQHPRWASAVSGGDINNGCLVLGPNSGNPPYDFIQSTRALNIGAGTFTWVIPWEYSCGSVINKEFTTLTHHVVFDGNQGATITKAGNSSSNP